MINDRKDAFLIKAKIMLASAGMLVAFVTWMVAAFVFFSRRDYGAEDLSFDRDRFRKESAAEGATGGVKNQRQDRVLPPCIIEANPETNPVYPPFSDDEVPVA